MRSISEAKTLPPLEWKITLFANSHSKKIKALPPECFRLLYQFSFWILLVTGGHSIMLVNNVKKMISVFLNDHIEWIIYNLEL